MTFLRTILEKLRDAGHALGLDRISALRKAVTSHVKERAASGRFQRAKVPPATSGE